MAQLSQEDALNFLIDVKSAPQAGCTPMTLLISNARRQVLQWRSLVGTPPQESVTVKWDRSCKR